MRILLLITTVVTMFCFCFSGNEWSFGLTQANVQRVAKKATARKPSAQNAIRWISCVNQMSDVHAS
jgi:hypothetical protein